MSEAAGAVLAESIEEAAEQADEAQGRLMPDSANEATGFPHHGRIRGMFLPD